MSVTLGQGLRNYTTLDTVLRSGIGTGCAGTRPVLLAAQRNAVESSLHETWRHSLTLGESTTRDGLRLASRTLQATLRPMYLASLLHLGFAGVFEPPGSSPNR